MAIKTRSLEERLAQELVAVAAKPVLPATAEFVVRYRAASSQVVDSEWLAEWAGWSKAAADELIASVQNDHGVPDTAAGRLFLRWLDTMRTFKGGKFKKRSWTVGEQRQIANALRIASEEDLAKVVDWAFHGDDQYALLLQGRISFDGSQPKVHLSVDTLFKDQKMARRIELADAWHTKKAQPEGDAFTEWLDTVALPALHVIVDGPDSYDAAYNWWAETVGRHEQGAAGDQRYALALLRLRQWRQDRGL